MLTISIISYFLYEAGPSIAGNGYGYEQ